MIDILFSILLRGLKLFFYYFMFKIIFKYLTKMNKNNLIYKPNKDNIKKINEINRINEYNSTFWLFNEHLQTLFITILRKKPQPEMKFFRDYLQTNDGGQISIDWREKKYLFDYLI